EAAVREGARALTAMAGTLPEGRPWLAAEAATWDAQTFHGWLAENLADPRARAVLGRSLEGVFGGPGDLSLLAALAIIRSGAHELTRLVAPADLGPERRVVGGAQLLCERLAERLAGRVILDAYVGRIEHGAAGALVTAGDLSFTARRVLVTLPPALAG